MPTEAKGRRAFQLVTEFTETRRNLPHMQEPGRSYFITFRVMHGELPGPARKITLDACLFWNEKKCTVHACVVMPNHAHLLITPWPLPSGQGYYNISELLHSVKSYAAHQINKLLGRRGTLWLDESFDRAMRDEKEFMEKWNYIRNNAVAWELADAPEDYPFLYEQM
ncbi:MAG: hypothetical protein FJ291_15080 [Planctomycetes bacterium]|nr:hypothetical protein [Planctomycetota bacterium]